MYENTSKDIHKGKINYSMISLISSKTNIGVIGSGKAGLIKAKHFLDSKCNVFMITKDVASNENINSLLSNPKFKLLCKKYYDDFLLDKHIIVIAVNDNVLSDHIKNKCDECAKIYIDCTDFKKGLAVVPSQRDSFNLTIGINTNAGNPKASVYIANKIANDISIYDDYVDFTTKIRNKLKMKDDLNLKKEVMNFILNDDFYYFYKSNKAEIILKMFYGEV